MAEIAKAQVDKLMKKYTGMRVSADAATELAETLEEIVMDLGNTAVDLAATSRRKTVNLSDVKLAVKQM